MAVQQATLPAPGNPPGAVSGDIQRVFDGEAQIAFAEDKLLSITIAF
jgi:hypothetical protein